MEIVQEGAAWTAATGRDVKRHFERESLAGSCLVLACCLCVENHGTARRPLLTECGVSIVWNGFAADTRESSEEACGWRVERVRVDSFTSVRQGTENGGCTGARESNFHAGLVVVKWQLRHSDGDEEDGGCDSSSVDTCHLRVDWITGARVTACDA